VSLVGGGPGVNPIHDFGWYRQHLYIQDRLTHQIVPLRPTKVQLAVRRAILDAEAAQIAARIIVLKARREGVSTIVQATFAHRAFTRKNVWAYTIAHEIDAASNLFGMTEQMYANLPPALRPPKTSGNLGRQLRLQNGAYLRTETARDVRAGRSGAATMLHGSEVGFWDHGDEVLRSILSTVPNAPGTIVVLESTANGIGNTFHRRWVSAEKGESGYTPLFFSWLEDPVYELPTKTLEDLVALDDEEEALVAILGASAGQLAWRRHTIRTEFDGDLDGFHQEYPSTPLEAFITSGRQYFGSAYISRFHPSEPKWRAQIMGEWKKGQDVTARRDDKGPLWIYEPCDKDHRYVMFIDPAGVVGEPRARHFSDPRDISDYTVMWVVDCSTMNTVAVFHDRLDLGKAGEVAAKLGRIYNNAVICPETTGGYGFVIVEKLRDLGYAAIHRDRNRQTYGRERTAVYGWSTSITTRPIMLETLRDVLRENPEVLRHAPLRDEMHTFIIGSSRPEAGPGTHDDLIFGAAGAYTIAADYAQRPPRHKLVGPQKKKPKGFNDILMRARG
jgi:hypothetical protein